MHTGIIHKRPSGDIMWGNNHTISPDWQQIPRDSTLNNHHFYMTDSIDIESLVPLLSRFDTVFGNEAGILTAIMIRTEPRNENSPPGKYKIYAPKIWDIDKRFTRLPTTLNAELERKLVLYASQSFVTNVGTSIAGTAFKTYMENYDGETVDGIEYPSFTTLPPRWRNLAQASFHGGPIACLRGGSEYAYEIDLKGAYLNALTKPVPVVTNFDPENPMGSGYVYRRNYRWKDIRNHNGFVEATVHVKESLKKGLPPLPINTSTGIQYPIGRFRGCWTIDHLREVEEHDEVKVLYVHQHAIANRMEPLFEHFARQLSSYHQDDYEAKLVSKKLYTRFWGKWGQKGGWTGAVLTDAENRIPEGLENFVGTQYDEYANKLDAKENGESVPHSKLWWTCDQIQQRDVGSPTYRPDIASYIASYNHMAVNRAVRLLDPESIIACHVDAIWTDDAEGARRVVDTIPQEPHTRSGNWVIKREGKLRYWASGIYEHDGKLAYSGWDKSYLGKPTAKKIAKWILHSQDKNNTSMNRRWIGPSSSVSETARSEAIALNQQSTYSVVEGIPVYANCWTAGGYMRE